MGLHHRFPSYFYKRGNLFNTYLSYTESAERPASQRSGRRRKDKKRAPARAEPNRRDEASPGVKRFSDFVKGHLATADAERLLRLLAKDASVDLDLSQTRGWSISMNLAYFAEQHLSDSQADAYAEALEQRLRAGEPLIQK